MTVDPGTGAGWEPANGVPTGALDEPAVTGVAPDAMAAGAVLPHPPVREFASPGSDPPQTGADPSEADADPSARVDEIERLLDAVESALDRLDDGTYGTCATCGEAIDDGRLRADATVLECAVCDARTAV
jgi:Prokaryotic dksA/traR C4-type zinc finger